MPRDLAKQLGGLAGLRGHAVGPGAVQLRSARVPSTLVPSSKRRTMFRASPPIVGVRPLRSCLRLCGCCFSCMQGRAPILPPVNHNDAKVSGTGYARGDSGSWAHCAMQYSKGRPIPIEWVRQGKDSGSSMLRLISKATAHSRLRGAGARSGRVLRFCSSANDTSFAKVNKELQERARAEGQEGGHRRIEERSAAGAASRRHRGGNDRLNQAGQEEETGRGAGRGGSELAPRVAQSLASVVEMPSR